jgi:hypothetical protein
VYERTLDLAAAKPSSVKPGFLPVLPMETRVSVELDVPAVQPTTLREVWVQPSHGWETQLGTPGVQGFQALLWRQRRGRWGSAGEDDQAGGEGGAHQETVGHRTEIRQRSAGTGCARRGGRGDHVSAED